MEEQDEEGEGGEPNHCDNPKSEPTKDSDGELVAITVVLAAVLYVLISGLTKGPGNTPLGAAMAVGTPIEAGTVYTFPIESASDIQASNLAFQIEHQGAIVTVTGGYVQVLNLAGTVVGNYSMTSGSWTMGASQQLTSENTLVLVSGASLSGDMLNIIGSGSYQGSISQSIA